MSLNVEFVHNCESAKFSAEKLALEQLIFSKQTLWTSCVVIEILHVVVK